MELTAWDRTLLDAIQASVPLVERPYAQLAAALGATQRRVIQAVAALSGPEGVIREIAGIFDATLLGYSSMLAAARVAPEKLDAAGAVVATHPGVSHCYSRPAAYNLWFTLVVPGESRLGLEGTAELLGKLAGAEHVICLPTLRRYKLRVNFAMGEPAEDLAEPASAPAAPAGAIRPDEWQIQAVRALQQPLPAEEKPFDALAATVGLSGDDLLVTSADLLAMGVLRRYSAVLRHRAAGSAVNVLVAWQVNEDQADDFGVQAAAVRNISHCYLRPSAPDWPYNFYTMMHGASQGEIDLAVEQLGHFAPLRHLLLPTGREYKKAKVRLFSPAFAEWERQHGR